MKSGQCRPPSLPPVFTNPCCKLVSGRFSIFFGSTRRRRFPKL
jgi:hypothetical protein